MRSGKGHRIKRFLLILASAILAIVSTITSPAFALEYNEEFLIGADFSNRDLRDASFTRAKLQKSNFSHSDLRGVSLFGAHLEKANLEGADLSYAVIGQALFLKANLTNAVLEGAFAPNSRFNGATIDGADFTDVMLRDDQQKMLCQVAKGTNPITKRDTRDTLNCP
ncbi:pentapeptide repeat-containing protein [Microseira wollei]|uniref:Pentapeptide repeat protein n=1 Tax=Microseira wollei NIES-4236 TaxID=2530354 RepID=A0AAV3X8N2_9CYAN|nr:pentapeptide repeat protein [Microseira wollei NIES-4236]